MTHDKEKYALLVKALLAKTLANGCTEEEALTAAYKARELMAKYQLTMADIDVKKEGAAHVEREGFANSPEMHVIITLYPVIGKFAECRAWQNQGGYKVNFVGMASDVMFCEWLLDMLCEFVYRNAKEYMKIYPRGNIGATKRAKVSFMIGCAERIRDRMYEEIAKRPKPIPGTGLVVVKDALITEKMNAMGIHLRPGKSKPPPTDPLSVYMGNLKGNEANWNKPMGDASKKERLGYE
jgi:hypothetical protein